MSGTGAESAGEVVVAALTLSGTLLTVSGTGLSRGDSCGVR